MPGFSYSEKADMILVLGKCNGNQRAAKAEYSRLYPTRRQPFAATFIQVLNCLSVYACFKKPYNSAGRCANQPARDELVLAAVNMDPHASTRRIAPLVDVSHHAVWASLKKQKYHPYHLHIHQALHGQDNMRRIEFCMYMREKLTEQPDFLEYVLMSDEATFHRDGNVNLHNSHYWSATNPHWLREGSHQVRWKTNVWCGVLGDRVVGPYFLGNLTLKRTKPFCAGIWQPIWKICHFKHFGGCGFSKTLPPLISVFTSVSI